MQKIVACDESHQRNFRALMSSAEDRDCLRCFDILTFDGKLAIMLLLFQRCTAFDELLDETDDQGVAF